MAMVSVESVDRAAGRKRHWRMKRGRKAFGFGNAGGGPSMATSGTSSCSESAREHIARGDEAHVHQNPADLLAALLLEIERANRGLPVRSNRRSMRISPRKRMSEFLYLDGGVQLGFGDLLALKSTSVCFGGSHDDLSRKPFPLLEIAIKEGEGEDDLLLGRERGRASRRC